MNSNKVVRNEHVMHKELYIHSQEKKGRKAVTRAVPFQKVHLFTLFNDCILHLL